MDQYVTTGDCGRATRAIKGRIKWLAVLLVLMVGITTITAEEAWRARNGFDRVNSRMERQTGVSETQIKGIQRSLDRIDRRLEQQEVVLMQLLRNNTRHDP